MSMAMMLALQLVAVVPPPPPPPEMARDPIVRERIALARDCVGGRSGVADFDGRFAAEKATRNLNAAPGSPEWKEAAAVASRYVSNRRREAGCLLDLRRFVFRANLSSSDARIARSDLHQLTMSWYGDAPYEANITARLIGRWSESDNIVPQQR